MLKKILFLLMMINVCSVATENKEEMSKRTKVILGCLTIIVGVAAAPFILPAATITAIQAAAAAGSAKIAAASAVASTTVGTAVTGVAGSTAGGFAASVAGGIVSVPTAIGVGVASVKAARPYIFETEEEELAQLKLREIRELNQARNNLLVCLIKNKQDAQKGSFDCSKHCQETAYVLGLLGGLDEIDRVVKSV